ncbi:MAG: hypothetical protein AVDCRST_MAG37-2637 [uncultured Rubrobacteraceae bacterium]|uniref:Uncharacterized protein n=1 Tax=uncultured Rubrobacteraceae bacterium TaxID=349277 RepID=A0A6J4QXC6_9ACTN|nr:MAG: hypothetical protein AVDCRST_MAG37-2637 [uncultured Rubrobacteraceae bacterium]
MIPFFLRPSTGWWLCPERPWRRPRVAGGHVEDEFLGITFTGGAGGSDKGGGSGGRF